jgi:hypothetical protein
MNDSAEAQVTYTLSTGGPGPGGGGGGGGAAPSASLSSTKADFDKDGGKDITVTINLNGFTLKSLTNGSYTLKEGADYTVSGNTVTIKAEYLATLAAGEQSITFNMSGGSNPKLTLNISDTPEKPSVMKQTRPAGTIVNALKTNNALILDGKEQIFPAVKIDDYNWLRLRDVAMLLNGTEKQFSIGYDAATNTITITTGEAYTPLGDELLDLLTEDIKAAASPQKLIFNGELIDVAAFNIGGYNYFRLRDLAILLDFGVIYDASSGSITLDLTEPYTE